MDDLIEALTIFKKYGDSHNPTYCQHVLLAVMCVNPSKVSSEDNQRLKELGFFVSKELGDPTYISFRFGSCWQGKLK